MQVAGFVAVAPVGVPNFTPQLKTNPVPTLVLWGGRDRVLPVSQAKVLAAGFAHASVRIIDGAKHPAYLDEPVLFHEMLLRFLSELGD